MQVMVQVVMQVMVQVVMQVMMQVVMQVMMQVVSVGIFYINVAEDKMRRCKRQQNHRSFALQWQERGDK
jgi:hypothetical protein